MNKPTLSLTPLLAALLLAGCATGPDYVRPGLELPTDWKLQPSVKDSRPADAAGERWWSLYGDVQLDQLMDEALAHNADLKIAAANVLEARALAGIARADRFPTVTAGASGVRSKSTREGSFPLPAGTPRIQNTYAATLDASYEVDLWGRYRRADEAAQAELLAAESARNTVRLTLTADVARQYFALRAADQRVAVLARTLASRDESLALLQRRVEVGAASEFDLRQAEAERLSIRSQLAGARRNVDTIEASLAQLLGRSPRAVIEDAVARSGEATIATLHVPAGLPSDLLLRRPDLVEAEQRLAASTARIGEARAQFFPSIALTASIGSESVELASLFSGPAAIFRLGLGLTQPIWNAGRLQGNVDAAKARHEAALARYRQAVAAAFGDVRRALAAQTAALETLDAEQARSATLRAALAQSELRFQAGVVSRIEVLDAERTLLQAELAEVDAREAQQGAVADLFRALGGGWKASGAPPS